VVLAALPNTACTPPDSTVPLAVPASYWTPPLDTVVPLAVPTDTTSCIPPLSMMVLVAAPPETFVTTPPLATVMMPEMLAALSACPGPEATRPMRSYDFGAPTIFGAHLFRVEIPAARNELVVIVEDYGYRGQEGVQPDY
jgi:hypothetical protein